MRLADRTRKTTARVNTQTFAPSLRHYYSGVVVMDAICTPGPLHIATSMFLYYYHLLAVAPCVVNPSLRHGQENAGSGKTARRGAIASTQYVYTRYSGDHRAGTWANGQQRQLSMLR